MSSNSPNFIHTPRKEPIHSLVTHDISLLHQNLKKIGLKALNLNPSSSLFLANLDYSLDKSTTQKFTNTHSQSFYSDDHKKYSHNMLHNGASIKLLAALE